MTVHALSRAEARQIALRAQLLDRTRPGGVVEVVQELTLLQVDQTKAVAPSADLVLWSRLGSGYEPAALTGALGRRELLEISGMIRPAGDLPLFRAEMADWPGAGATGWRARRGEWVTANDACRRDLLARLAADGPQTSRELPDTCVVPWQSSGWNNDRNVIRLLDLLALRGEVAVAGRRGPDKLWDLAERVYPDGPTVPLDEARRQRADRRLASLGVARPTGPESEVEPHDVGEAGEPATIEGIRGKWRVDPAQLGLPFDPRVALLSPLDRLIFDRKRMAEVFEFDYQLEMYKKPAERRWGYYALPILAGDRLLGKIDAAADRKSEVLRVAAIHQDEPFDEETLDEVRVQLRDLADWLELDLALPR